MRRDVSRSSTVASESLLNRVAVLRSEGRRRRLLVQLPPAFGGVSLALTGIALNASLLIERHIENAMLLVGLLCIFLGPWCAGLALRPQDRRMIRVFCTFSACLGFVGASSGVPSTIDGLAAARASNQSLGVSLFLVAMLISYSGCVMGSAIWIHAVIADVFFSTSAFRTITRLWRGCGVLYLCCAISFAMFGFMSIVYPSPLLFSRIDTELLVVISLTTLTLGSLAFWEPLRTRVQEALTRIGEGVSAAAGIAELIGGSSPAEIVARARLSFRAVPIASLQRKHLEPPRPAKPPGETYQRMRTLENVSTPASQRPSCRSSGSGKTSAATTPRAQPTHSAAVAPEEAPVPTQLGLSHAELFATSVPAQLGSVDAFIRYSRLTTYPRLPLAPDALLKPFQ